MRGQDQEQVLRGLGWEILRIWSTDWWVDAKGTLDRVCSQLDELLVVSRTKRASEAEKAAAEAREAIEKAMAETALQPNAPAESKPGNDASPSASQAQGGLTHDVEEAYARRPPVSTKGERSGARLYVECDPTSAVEMIEPDAFFDQAYDERLQAMVAFVVGNEGPILDLALARRISRAHGWQRTGSRIQERVEEVARRHFKTTEEDVGTFYWPDSLPPGSAVTFRPPGPDTQRSMDEVCMEELVALAENAVGAAATDDEKLVLMARELGISRLRASSRGRLEDALKRFLAER